MVLLAGAGALFVWRAVLLLSAGRPLAVALGAAVLVVAAVGIATVAAEVRFGVRSAALARRLDLERGLPEDVLVRTPSGRIDRAAADADFGRWQADVELDPGDWRAWYRLALAYDAARDRRRARTATRRAIALAGGPGTVPPRGPADPPPDASFDSPPDSPPGTVTGEAGRGRRR